MMAKGHKGRESRVERKTIEKNRRMHMKGLCFKLASLVPRNHAAEIPKEESTQLDQLDEATAYIKKLHERIEELQRRKQAALGQDDVGGIPANNSNSSISNGGCTSNGADTDAPHHQPQQLEKEPLPLLDVRVLDTVLEVVLVSAADSNNSFTLFYRVMEALEEQGARVANAGFSVVKDKIFCTIHAQVALPPATMERVSVAVTERLTSLLC